MRTIFTILFSFLVLASSGQIKRFLVQAQIVDQNDDPISDVYVVNLDNHEKDISHENGGFTLWVSPNDSLVLSHISYFRKIVSVQSLLVNPKVQLISEHVDIPEIVVSPEQITDIDRARGNMVFMDEYSSPVRMRIEEEDGNPVTWIMTANNVYLRSEASSISLVAFSPSESIGRLFTNLKKDRYTDYDSTRKTREELEKKKNK
ncbi:hypothetical protein SLH46_15770 [Draconibacterium sp. IB214405]|uniref:hypothetical protein n=1 Tax=Draconibacterium sp. IB214405 TaxID=3097352 RepID=UPI002A110AA2|nr:hypothetical protein [Draconibacterium sp. IB214405]MDX8340656.1 hypothetical protein [Draconibacterium sp. IB214405]